MVMIWESLKADACASHMKTYLSNIKSFGPHFSNNPKLRPHYIVFPMDYLP